MFAAGTSADACQESCQCGMPFAAEAVFCRRCGRKRSTTSAPQRSLSEASTPTAKHSSAAQSVMVMMSEVHAGACELKVEPWASSSHFSADDVVLIGEAELRFVEACSVNVLLLQSPVESTFPAGTQLRKVVNHSLAKPLPPSPFLKGLLEIGEGLTPSDVHSITRSRAKEAQRLLIPEDLANKCLDELTEIMQVKLQVPKALSKQDLLDSDLVEAQAQLATLLDEARAHIQSAAHGLPDQEESTNWTTEPQADAVGGAACVSTKSCPQPDGAQEQVLLQRPRAARFAEETADEDYLSEYLAAEKELAARLAAEDSYVVQEDAHLHRLPTLLSKLDAQNMHLRQRMRQADLLQAGRAEVDLLRLQLARVEASALQTVEAIDGVPGVSAAPSYWQRPQADALQTEIAEVQLLRSQLAQLEDAAMLTAEAVTGGAHPSQPRISEASAGCERADEKLERLLISTLPPEESLLCLDAQHQATVSWNSEFGRIPSIPVAERSCWSGDVVQQEADFRSPCFGVFGSNLGYMQATQLPLLPPPSPPPPLPNLR